MIKFSTSATVAKNVVDVAILDNGVVKHPDEMYFGDRLVYRRLPKSFSSDVPGTYSFTVPETGRYVMNAVGGGGGCANDGDWGSSCAGGGSGAYAKTEMTLTKGQVVTIVVAGIGEASLLKIGDQEICAAGGGGHGDVSNRQNPAKGVGGVARVGNVLMVNGKDGTAQYLPGNEPSCGGGDYAVPEYPYGRGGDCWFRIGLGEWEVTAPQNGFADISKID